MCQVEVRKQRTAFPPNFVHSLDGSHMMMTAVACRDAKPKVGDPDHVGNCILCLVSGCLIWLTCSWYKNGVVTPMRKSLKPHVEMLEKSAGIKIATDWVEDEGYDYLGIKFSNNFSSTLTPWRMGTRGASEWPSKGTSWLSERSRWSLKFLTANVVSTESKHGGESSEGSGDSWNLENR